MTALSIHPPIVLTMGEPAAIGAEIALKAWQQRFQAEIPCFLMVDWPERLRSTAYSLGFDVPVVNVASPREAIAIWPEALPVLPLSAAPQGSAGQPCTDDAPLIIESIRRSVALVQAGEASAVVTNPLHKTSFIDCGINVPGHTEYLGQLTGGSPFMMLAIKGLKVVPFTIHIPLKDVATSLSIEKLINTITQLNNSLRQDFLIERPIIAVAGLNPHAGEYGTMGREEIDIIIPAIKQLRAFGVDIQGPLSADTMFTPEKRASYDVALCMYHDQALIPLKTLDFHGGVNITLGLNIIRTSPDHGTALDIAGKGIAREDSLIAALKMAAELAEKRQKAAQL
ncbi:MAG: 4-hydroxythreonine-4-phosphate dehydrogenase PdxA [Alphaproteobacteria bacterium]